MKKTVSLGSAEHDGGGLPGELLGGRKTPGGRKPVINSRARLAVLVEGEFSS